MRKEIRWSILFPPKQPQSGRGAKWWHFKSMVQIWSIQKHKLETARSRRIDILISISFCGFTAKKRRWNQTKVTLRENLSLWLNFLLLEIHPVHIQLNRMTFDWTDGERKWQDTSGFKLSNLVYCLPQQPLKLNEYIQEIHHNAICGVLL